MTTDCNEENKYGTPNNVYMYIVYEDQALKAVT